MSVEQGVLFGIEARRIGSFLPEIVERGRKFRTTYEAQIDPHMLTSEGQAELDLRFADSPTQRALRAFTSDSLGLIIPAVNLSGAPAHDSRHIIERVPVHALTIIKALDVHPHLLESALPSVMMHDIGRLFETGVYDTGLIEAVGRNHAAISYDIAARMLANYDIPQELKDHLLYAIVAHQDTPTPQNKHLLDLPHVMVTQGADRGDLLGVEVKSRIIANEGGFRRFPFALPSTMSEEEIRRTIPGYMAYMIKRVQPASAILENPELKKQILEAKAEGAIFLRYFLGDRFNDVISCIPTRVDELIPGVNYDSKTGLPEEIIQRTKDLSPANLRIAGIDVLREFLFRRGAVVLPDQFNTIKTGFQALPKDDQNRLNVAMIYGMQVRRIEEARQKSRLNDIVTTAAAGSMTHMVAQASLYQMLENITDTHSNLFSSPAMPYS